MNQDKYIRIKEVCNRTGFSMQTVRKMIKNGLLEGYLINNRWYTTEIQYDKFRCKIYCQTKGCEIDELSNAINKIYKDDFNQLAETLSSKLNINYDKDIFNLFLGGDLH